MRGVSQATSKQAIRSAIQSQRQRLGLADARSWSQAAQTLALALVPYRAAAAVALYSPIHNEVATGEIFHHALAVGKQVFFPRIEPDRSLALIRAGSAADFKPGPLGILEPNGSERLDLGARSVIVFVPGIAFDPQGNRLGHGKGYYDRLLSGLSTSAALVALAYEFQVVEAVPCESWDQKVHLIVTERRIIDCASKLALSVQSV